MEKVCRVSEDQLNESRSRADELQRQLNEVSAQKARALTEAGTSLSVCLSVCPYM